MNDYIHIKLPKCDLYFTQKEVYQLLRGNKAIWKKAIKRGKHIKRAERFN